MQEIIKISENNLQTKKAKRRSHLALAKELLRDKEKKTVFSVLIAVFALCCLGVWSLSGELLSIAGFDDFICRAISARALSVITLLLEYVLFIAFLFPLMLGIYAYFLDFAKSDDARIIKVFSYYTSRKKYFFALRLSFRLTLVVIFVLALSLCVAYLGAMLARYLVSVDGVARATLALGIAFLCNVSLSLVAIFRLCDCFAFVSLSQDENCSFKDICTTSGALAKGNRRKIILNFAVSLLLVAVSVFSAGILLPVLLPIAILSRALLENDIINEYKIKNNI